MKFSAKNLLAFLLISSCSSSSAQSTVQQLERYLKQVSVENSTPLPPAVLSDFQSENALLKILYSHRNDPGEDFQFRVLDLIRLIGLKSKNQGIRMSVVNHFVESIPEKNLRIGGVASAALVQFLKPDFSKTNKDSIVSYLRLGMPNLDGLFRLAGFLEIPSAKEKISSMLILPMSPILKWNARLALARLGDEKATNFILEKVTTSTVDDSFVYSIIPGLVYTRNAKVFLELEKIIQSDVYACRSSHPDSKATIICAYRVLENVASAIEKFPIKVDESGDMIVDNYQSALETARRWLKQNPDYTLSRNTM
jgi:hypothetical protein